MPRFRFIRVGLFVNGDNLRDVGRRILLTRLAMYDVADFPTFTQYSKTGAKIFVAVWGGMELPNALDACRSDK